VIIKLYEIAETKTFEKIKNFVYPQLRENPFYGNNIKKLKGELSEFYRYRIGNYRLFYFVEDDKRIVAIIDFKHRQNAYD